MPSSELMVRSSLREGALAARVVLAASLLAAVGALVLIAPVAAGVPLCVVLPVAVLAVRATLPFERVKLGTLVVGRVLTAAAVLGLLGGDPLCTAMVWLLRINVAEAA